MRAITLTEPWATLVAIGAKRIETRAWRVGYRGPLAIHAAKGYPPEARLAAMGEPFRSVLRASGRSRSVGAVVAICRLLDCVPIHYNGLDLPPGCTIGEHEFAFGHFAEGRWAWLLDDVRPLATPLPARGALGLWEWDAPDDLQLLEAV